MGVWIDETLLPFLGSCQLLECVYKDKKSKSSRLQKKVGTIKGENHFYCYVFLSLVNVAACFGSLFIGIYLIR